MKQLDPGAVIDAAPLSGLQWSVMVLCTLIIVLDGFDVQAIAFTGPAIAEQWALGGSHMGPVFAAGLAGMTLGALAVGPLGDRFGRKLALTGSVAAFGLFTLLTAWAQNFEQLMILRLLTGIGLGGALPNATALMTEYAPQRLRNMAIAIIFLGIPIGGITGGLLSAQLIPAFGWPSVFVAGGLAPLALVPVLWWVLPESVNFLVRRGTGQRERVARLLHRIDPAVRIDADTELVLHEPAKTGFPVSRLFDPGYAADTVKLWAVFFTNLMAVYFLISWIPSLLVDAGFGIEKATLTAVVLNLGGVVGPLVLAGLVARLGSRLAISGFFVLASISIAVVGRLEHSLDLLMVGVFAAGFFTFGAQISINALAASMYPTDTRSTGVGWALGIGRLGSILGPVLGGVLIGLQLGMPTYFTLFGSLLLVAAVMLFLIRRQQPPVRG